MLVFRLFRVGKNNQPSYKIVVTDKRNPSKGGRFVEQVGFYNPVTKEKVLNKERIQYWLKQGVQPSPTLHNLFVKDGILEGKKIPVQKKSKKPIGAGHSAELSRSPQGKAAAAPASAEATAGKPVVAPAAAKMKEAEPLSSKAPKAAEVEAPAPAEKSAENMLEVPPPTLEAPKTE